MKVQLISDTHGKHREMIIDTSVDMIVHSGDSTNYYDISRNQVEFYDFLEWFSSLDIKHKVMVAGNHDAWATKSHNRKLCEDSGIHLLMDDYISIEGKLIFGSPWSPRYGNWHFMRPRHKLGSFWGEVLIEGIDLLITHTPPKGILDVTFNYERDLELAGCSGLIKAVSKFKPKHHVFGHIHNSKDVVNFGTRTVGGTNFYNASAVKDGDFHNPPMNARGIIINI